MNLNYFKIEDGKKFFATKYNVVAVNLNVANPMLLASMLRKYCGIKILNIEDNNYTGLTVTMALTPRKFKRIHDYDGIQLRLIQRQTSGGSPFDVCIRSKSVFEDAVRNLQAKGIIEEKFIHGDKSYIINPKDEISLDEDQLIVLERLRYSELIWARKDLLLMEYGLDAETPDFLFDMEEYSFLNSTVEEIQLKVRDLEKYVDLFKNLGFTINDTKITAGTLSKVKFNIDQQSGLQLSLELDKDNNRTFQNSIRFVLNSQIDSAEFRTFLKHVGHELAFSEETMKDLEEMDGIDYYKFGFGGFNWLVIAGDAFENGKLPSLDTEEIDF